MHRNRVPQKLNNFYMWYGYVMLGLMFCLSAEMGASWAVTTTQSSMAQLRTWAVTTTQSSMAQLRKRVFKELNEHMPDVLSQQVLLYLGEGSFTPSYVIDEEGFCIRAPLGIIHCGPVRDGKRKITTFGDDGSVKCEYRSDFFKNCVRGSLILSKNPGLVACVTPDSGVIIGNWNTGKSIGTLSNSQHVSQMIEQSDGSLIATRWRNIICWNIHTGTSYRVVKCLRSPQLIAMLDDDRLLITFNTTINVISISQKKCLKIIKTDTLNPLCVVLSPHKIAALLRTKQYNVLSLETCEIEAGEFRALKQCRGATCLMQLLGERLVVGGNDGSLEVIDTRTGVSKEALIHTKGYGVNNLLSSQSGHHFASCSNKRIVVWRPNGVDVSDKQSGCIIL